MLLREYIQAVLQEKMAHMRKMSEPGQTFAMLSAYVDAPKSENVLRHRDLMNDIRGLGYRRVYETKAPPWPRIVEKGVTVSGMSFEHAVMLGRKYQQEAIGFKGADGLVAFYNFAESSVTVPRSVLETAFPVMSTKRDLYSKARGLSFEWDLENAIVLPWDGVSEMTLTQVQEILKQNPL